MALLIHTNLNRRYRIGSGLNL